MNFDSFSYVYLFQIFGNLFFIFLWKNKKLTRYHNVYNAEQKIHHGFISRFGGLVMILTFFLNLFVIDLLVKEFLFNLFIILLPLIFITFLEDVYNNILPLARLFVIFLVSFLVLLLNDYALPIVDFPLLANFFIDNPYILIILLTFLLASVINAFNLIDGVNGLLLCNFISILICLLLMAHIFEDYLFIYSFNLLLCICFVQLFFNFPKAFIFAGDLGAYSFGFMITFLLIIFFGAYPSFLTWQCVVILFYPCFELLFTFIRRVLNKKNVFNADRLHLHHLVFDYLINKTKSLNLSNPLVTIVLCPLWGFAPYWIWLNGIELNLYQILIGLLIQSLLYFLYFFIFKIIK